MPDDSRFVSVEKDVEWILANMTAHDALHVKLHAVLIGGVILAVSFLLYRLIHG